MLPSINHPIWEKIVVKGEDFNNLALKLFQKRLQKQLDEGSISKEKGAKDLYHLFSKYPRMYKRIVENFHKMNL